LNAIPSKWTPYVVGAVLCLPYLTRGWSGWRNAGGLRGIWNGVMNGTNTPKPLAGADLGRAVFNAEAQRTQRNAEETTGTKATQ
jgi:hypothetical protein